MTVKGQDDRERFRTTVKGQDDRERFRMTAKGQDDRERFKMIMTGQDDKKMIKTVDYSKRNSIFVLNMQSDCESKQTYDRFS